MLNYDHMSYYKNMFGKGRGKGKQGGVGVAIVGFHQKQ